MAIQCLLLLVIPLVSLPLGVHALALRPRSFLEPRALPQAVLDHSTRNTEHLGASTVHEQILIEDELESQDSISSTLDDLLSALGVMQDEYFEVWLGTWPTSIDWTAAVLGTQVSATLASLTFASDLVTPESITPPNSGIEKVNALMSRNSLAFENLIDYYFDQVQSFYFGENAFSLRNQAYDDMLWVVLGWLENIKFQELHHDLHYTSMDSLNITAEDRRWHGTQFRNPAAHRARIFYELAAEGWDETLCDGGMIWNPNLSPYKNAITNELFISASVGMYLYFPGDPFDSPFIENSPSRVPRWKHAHDPSYLEAAVEGYRWLKNSNMTGMGGLYADGFHISGWQSSSRPGSRKCDVLNTMVYTYNQGVILSGLRGLWLATESTEYLRDGHELVSKVIDATGWPDTSSTAWTGLGRGGILEEFCDSWGTCSQDSQTFKSIFFHHLAEFCRPLQPQEERFLDSRQPELEIKSDWEDAFEWHQGKCRSYGRWIEHNANAALMTKNDEGKFGTWWGRKYRAFESALADSSSLPDDAIDHYTLSRSKRRRDTGFTSQDYNDRGRGRTVESQAGGVAILRSLFQWKTSSWLQHY